jgi:hypothetical protein
MGNLGTTEILLILFVIGIGLIPMIFFLITLQRAFQRVSPQNRTMEPGQVWMMLIPLFNIVWQFIVVSKMSESLAREFRERNIAVEPEPGKTLGIAFCILGICSIIPILGILSSLAALVCWIMYWVKISGYSNQLAVPMYNTPISGAAM